MGSVNAPGALLKVQNALPHRSGQSPACPARTKDAYRTSQPLATGPGWRKGNIVVCTTHKHSCSNCWAYCSVKKSTASGPSWCGRAQAQINAMILDIRRATRIIKEINSRSVEHENSPVRNYGWLTFSLTCGSKCFRSDATKTAESAETAKLGVKHGPHGMYVPNRGARSTRPAPHRYCFCNGEANSEHTKEGTIRPYHSRPCPGRNANGHPHS